MKASDVMTENVFSVSPGDSIAHVRKQLVRHSISILPVVDGGKVTGLVTERAISDALYHLHEPIDAVPVRDVMRKGVPSVAPNTSIPEVARVLSAEGSPCVIVFEATGVVGIITKTDLARHFAASCPGEAAVAQLMRPKVQTIGRFHSIFRAAKEMEEHDIGRLVVMDGGPVGILTARDLALATYGLRPERLVYMREKSQKREVRFKPVIVDDLMQQDLYTIQPKSDAASAAKLMLERKIGSVVVVDLNELRGIITKTDIVNYLAKKA